MKHKGILLTALFLAAALLFSSCAPPASSASVGADSARFRNRSLTVLMDMGGMGSYYQPIITALQLRYPGLTVASSYEIKAGDIFRIKALSDNLPDIFNLNQGIFSYDNAIRAGYCLPVDGILNAPLPDGQTLWDLLEPDMIDYGAYGDRHYLMSEVVTLAGMWYDAALFQKNNLALPATWEEFLQTCALLKQKNRRGVGYCGYDMANEYAAIYWFLPMLNSVSRSTFLQMDRGDPEAWRRPEMLQTLYKLVQLRDSGSMDRSTLTMKNAETQMMFLNREFAFLPCGSWLENEMAGFFPEDFRLSFLPFSGRDTADGENYVCKMPLVSAVSAKTENLDIITEFYRLMYTDPAVIRGQVAIHRNTLPIRHFRETYGHLLGASVQQVWAAVDQGVVPFVTKAYIRYPDFSVLTGQCINQLMNSKITPEEFAETMYRQFLELNKS